MAQKKLPETELRVLAELEEYGCENVPTLMNTITDPNGGGSEVSEIQRALTHLLELRLIDMQMSSLPGGDVELSIQEAQSEIDSLGSHLLFDVKERYWKDDRMKGPPYFQVPVPEVVRTELGLEAGVKVLEERGYQWWRQGQ